MIQPDAWTPADGLQLEPNALKAATEQSRSLALTAGPGAGKTEMLAQRADFLLRTGTCRYPKRILAICFKADASRNLKDRVRYRCGPELASRFDCFTFHAFSKRIIDRFRVLLTGNDALNPDYTIGHQKVTREQILFDEMIPLATEILGKSAIARNAVRQTYSDVFLDEFQDCTDKQYSLILRAFRGTSIRLTAVGDTKQKIMGWAGALDGIFSRFATDFSALPLNMYRNFRSQPRLLRMQNEIVRVMDPAAVMPDKEIVGTEGDVAICRFANDEEETERLVKMIGTWILSEGVPPSEIAVLVSRQPELYAAGLMKGLSAAGIPYRNEQHLQDISAEPLARLIADYLACIYGKREPAAWMRLMDQLIPFADEDLQASVRTELHLLLKQRRKDVTTMDSLGERFGGWWDHISPLFKKVGRAALVALSPDYESESRMKEVIKDTRIRIQAFFDEKPDLLDALARFAGKDAVRILTIHKSKGLEFDSVVVLGVEKETFWANLIEERSAYFVGISRAKRRLALTVSAHRERPEGARRWDERRRPHDEFLGYAAPFINAPG